jgi:hypothetical protein
MERATILYGNKMAKLEPSHPPGVLRGENLVLERTLRPRRELEESLFEPALDTKLARLCTSARTSEALG